MINLKTNKAKRLYHTQFNKMIEQLAQKQTKKLTPVFNSIYDNAASKVMAGNKKVSGAVVAKTPQLRLLFSQHYQTVGDVFASQVIDFGKNAGIVIEQKNLGDDFWGEMRGWMKTETAKHVTEVTASVKERLRKVIEQGVEEGLGVEAIARNIRDKKQFNTFRARVIARTETHNAAIFATDKSVELSGQQLGIDFERSWFNMGDGRVRGTKLQDRFNHVKVHNQKRPMKKPFLVSGERLMRPGDGSLGASPGNLINCRCVVTYDSKKKKIKLPIKG